MTESEKGARRQIQRTGARNKGNGVKEEEEKKKQQNQECKNNYEKSEENAKIGEIEGKNFNNKVKHS